MRRNRPATSSRPFATRTDPTSASGEALNGSTPPVYEIQRREVRPRRAVDGAEPPREIRRVAHHLEVVHEADSDPDALERQRHRSLGPVGNRDHTQERVAGHHHDSVTGHARGHEVVAAAEIKSAEHGPAAGIDLEDLRPVGGAEQVRPIGVQPFQHDGVSKRGGPGLELSRIEIERDQVPPRHSRELVEAPAAQYGAFWRCRQGLNHAVRAGNPGQARSGRHVVGQELAALHHDQALAQPRQPGHLADEPGRLTRLPGRGLPRRGVHGGNQALIVVGRKKPPRNSREPSISSDVTRISCEPTGRNVRPAVQAASAPVRGSTAHTTGCR